MNLLLREHVSGNEAGKKIVCPDETTSPHDEQLKILAVYSAIPDGSTYR
jgi:hypothetical protein